MGKGRTREYEWELVLCKGVRQAETRVHGGEGLNGGVLILTEYYGMN